MTSPIHALLAPEFIERLARFFQVDVAHHRGGGRR